MYNTILNITLVIVTLSLSSDSAYLFLPVMRKSRVYSSSILGSILISVYYSWLPVSPCQMSLLDFSKTSLANDYPSGSFYVKVLDGLFTPDECSALIHFAETGLFDFHQGHRPPGNNNRNPWQIQTAAIDDYGLRQQVVDKSRRDCETILRFDDEVACALLYRRLVPYIPEIMEIRPGDEWHDSVTVGCRSQQVWRMVG